MASRTQRNEIANAEILGVVILIGIFAVTAGIISATTLATPSPEKVPAASIEITKASATSLRIAHLGGDALPLDRRLVVRAATTSGPIPPIEGPALQGWLPGLSGQSAINNGFSDEGDATGWVAAVLIWRGGSGESVIARWDPSGLYGPLGPPAPSGGTVPGIPSPAPTEPPVPTPTTNWSYALHNITANFIANPTAGQAKVTIIHFTDLSTGNVTITNWSWNFGDGGTSTLKNPDHVYDSSGTYTVTLTVSNQTTGASDTVVKARCVQIGGTPSPVDFDLSATQGNTALTVVCTDRSQADPTLWRWTAVDGLNLSVTTVGPGGEPVGVNASYDPKVQVFTFLNPSGLVNNTCSITLEIWSPYFESPISMTKFVTVGPPLRANFTPNATVGVAPPISGCPIFFLDTSAGIPQAWQWDFGDGGSSTDQNPIHIFTVGPNQIRTFTVRLTASGWGQTSTVTHDVTIHPAVAANFTANVTEGTPPLTVAFRDTSTGSATGWLWNFGDGHNSTLQNPVHTFTKVGKYDVTLIAEKANPHSADEKTIDIYIRVGPEVIADFTGTPRSGDAPLDVRFMDRSTNAIKWAYSFGDGGTSTLPNPSHIYSNPGNYTVSLTAEGTFRNNTTTKVGYISVMGPISATFTGAPRAVPVGGSVQFTNTSTGNPYTFAWNFGDGVTSSQKNPVHTYSAAGTYPVSLTATNSLHTNTHTEAGYITVYDQVHASFTANQTGGPVPLHVKFTDTSTGNPTAWTWNFGDGDTSTSQNPVHTYRNPGTYSVTLNASNGYSSYTTTALNYIITVYGPLGAQFTANQTAGPRPLTVQFTDTSTGNPAAWAWDFNGDGVTDSTVRNPIRTFSAAGTYNVVLTVTHAGGSVTSAAPFPITVYDPITAQFTANPSSGATPLTVAFTDTSIGGGDTRLWRFGDGATSNLANPVHTYSTAGTYTADLTVWHHLRPDLNSTASTTIVAYGLPNAAFTASPKTGIAPLSVQFTDTSTGNPTEWSWNFGDGGTSTEQNPTHIFNGRGRVYTVTLTVRNSAGVDPTPATCTINVM